MTLIAAILPPGRPPVFINDTLVSIRGKQTGRMLTPNGLIAVPPKAANWKPDGFEQKSIILNGNIFATYTGVSFVAKAAMRDLSKRFNGSTSISRDDVAACLEERAEQFQQQDTSILAGVINGGALSTPIVIGSGFETKTLDDGTQLIANGSGPKIFLDEFPSAWFGTKSPDHPDYDLAKAFAFCASNYAFESVNAELESHFGGIFEITTIRDGAFGKIGSATVMVELVKFEGKDTARLAGGNYLSYAYDGDLLAFHRFGQINYDEIISVFGTDVIAGALASPLRKPTRQEIDSTAQRFIDRPIFNDSHYQLIVWHDVDNLNWSRVDTGSHRVMKK